MNTATQEKSKTTGPRLSVGDADTWMEIGELCLDRGLVERAIRAFRRALDFTPEDDAGRVRLSDLLYSRKRAAEAVAVMAESATFTPRSFNHFCNIATWSGAFGTLARVIEKHAANLGHLKFRSDLAMAYVWRCRGNPELERLNLESARDEAGRLGHFQIQAAAIEQIREWDIAHGDETAAAHVFTFGLERSHALDAASSADNGKVHDIHSFDQKEGFNISNDVAFASALGMYEEGADPPSLHVHRRIVPLFRRSFPFLRIQAYAPEDGVRALGATDLHLRELPLVARHAGVGGTSPVRAYLKADPEQVALIKARNRRRSGGRPNIGLCWRSSSLVDKGFRSSAGLLTRNRIDFDTYLSMANRFWRKGIPLPYFSAIITDPNLEVVSMQYGLGGWEAERLSTHATYRYLHLQPIDHLGDLDRVAAELSALDAFVSTPGGYAHLSAALGVPTLVLLTDQPPQLWVWNERFAIYPRVKLYRKQPVWRNGDMVSPKYSGDWTSAVACLHRDLSKLPWSA